MRGEVAREWRRARSVMGAKLRGNGIGSDSRGAQRTVPALAALVFVLCANDIGGGTVGLPASVTTNRIALVLLFGILVVRLVPGARGAIAIPRWAALVAFALTFAAGWGVVSFLRSPFQDGVSTGYIASWLILGLLVVSFSTLFIDSSPVFVKRFIDCVILAGSLATLWIIYINISKIGLAGLQDSYRFRNHLDEFGTGLNRTMTGLLYQNAFAIATVLGVIRRRGLVYSAALVSVSGFVVFELLTGSRQTLLAATVYCGVVLIMRRRSRRVGSVMRRTTRDRSRFIRIFALVGAVTFVIWLLNSYVDLTGWFARRFIDTTVGQLESQESYQRIALYLAALEIIGEYPLFGIGPGAFHRVVGVYPHNGYVGFAAEFGLIPALVVYATAAGVCLMAYRRVSTMLKDGSADLYCVAISSVLTNVFVSNFFNDLIRSYVLWAYVSLLIVSVLRPRGVGGPLVRSKVTPHENALYA